MKFHSLIPVCGLVVCVCSVVLAQEEPAPGDTNRVKESAAEQLAKLVSGYRLGDRDFSVEMWPERLSAIELHFRLTAAALRGDKTAQLAVNAFVMNLTVNQLLEAFAADVPPEQQLALFAEAFERGAEIPSDAELNPRFRSVGRENLRIGLLAGMAQLAQMGPLFESEEGPASLSSELQEVLREKLRAVLIAAIEVADTDTCLALTSDTPNSSTDWWDPFDYVRFRRQLASVIHTNERLAALDQELVMAVSPNQKAPENFDAIDATLLTEFGRSPLLVRVTMLTRSYRQLVHQGIPLVTIGDGHDTVGPVRERLGAMQSELRNPTLEVAIKVLTLVDALHGDSLTEEAKSQCERQLRSLGLPLDSAPLDEIWDRMFGPEANANQVKNALTGIAGVDPAAIEPKTLSGILHAVDILRRIRQVQLECESSRS